MRIFDYLDYKAFLKAEISRPERKRGLRTKLAMAAGCQRAYFSQVLSSHIQLTPDHAEGIAAHLELDELETDYFLGLVDLARAGRRSLRERIQRKLARLREESRDVGAQFRTESAIQTPEQLAEYYSSWIYAAAHIVISIPEFQTVGSIARRLGLAQAQVREALESLRRMGLARHEGERWMHAPGNLHLPKDSPHNQVNHQNWRARAVLDSHSPGSAGTHYTLVFSASRADIDRLRSILLDQIGALRAVMDPSPCEELACFTCDLFTV